MRPSHESLADGLKEPPGQKRRQLAHGGRIQGPERMKDSGTPRIDELPRHEGERDPVAFRVQYLLAGGGWRQGRVRSEHPRESAGTSPSLTRRSANHDRARTTRARPRAPVATPKARVPRSHGLVLNLWRTLQAPVLLDADCRLPIWSSAAANNLRNNRAAEIRLDPQ